MCSNITVKRNIINRVSDEGGVCVCVCVRDIVDNSVDWCILCS